MIRKISKILALVAGVGILVAGNSISAMAATYTIPLRVPNSVTPNAVTIITDVAIESGWDSVNDPNCYAASHLYFDNVSAPDEAILHLCFPAGTTASTVNFDTSFTYNGVSYTYAGSASIDSNTLIADSFGTATRSSSSASATASVKSPEEEAVERMYEDINQTANEVALAVQGMNFDGSANPSKIVECEGEALNGIIMNSMTNAPGVTLFFDYNYAGFRFRSAITPELAAQYFNANIPWYGPCYIAERFPTVMTGPAL